MHPIKARCPASYRSLFQQPISFIAYHCFTQIFRFFIMSSALGLILVLLKLLARHVAADNPAGEETNCNGNHGQIETDGNLCLTQSGPMCTLAFCGCPTPYSFSLSRLINTSLLLTNHYSLW
jgi:hypothetical protein